MRATCHRCGEQELNVESEQVYRLGVPWLTSLFQREIERACPVCGHVIHWQMWVTNAGPNLPGIFPRPLQKGDAIERKRPTVSERITTSDEFTTVSYPAVFRSGENVLFPVSEGNIQDATIIDQHGDPDLMTNFAEEYLRQFWNLMPTGRMPSTLREIMPALLLLVTAAELAVKAYWIRSGRKPDRSHSLIALYRELLQDQKEEVERRFAASDTNTALQVLGVRGPDVEEILEVYSKTYGGESDVHKDSRYFAEPTTMFRTPSNLQGANLVKGMTPYPIFLPDAVRSLIETYRFYSGTNRLRRLGADLRDNCRDRGEGSHGQSGLIPASLGLVVIAVSQKAGKDANNENLTIFNDFKESYPTDFSVDWMYGGNTLLFYRETGTDRQDGIRTIGGLECRVWSKGRLGLHPRDLHLLAAALEGSGPDGDKFGHLPNQGVPGR